MKLIITILLLTISTFSFAQKKHWENDANNKIKKKIATRYSTLTKNKPATTYTLKRYNRKTKLLLESVTYLTKKALVKEGGYITYHFNKAIKEKGVFKNNLKDGEWKTYYDNGNKKEILLYKKGTLVKTIQKYDYNGNEIKNKRQKHDDIVYMIVENPAEFPGGGAALMKFLAENTKYPQEAKDSEIQDRVYISFTVEKDGSINDVKGYEHPEKEVHQSLLKEAIRVVESMPRWKPGSQRGKAVRVKYTVPVNFKIR